jgi:hypothetical protein
MSSKLTRAAFQQLIAEDIAWLEAQPRTLEREHVIMCVRESERYYYVEAQDEAIKAAQTRALRLLEPKEIEQIAVRAANTRETIVEIVNFLLKRRQDADHP